MSGALKTSPLTKGPKSPKNKQKIIPKKPLIKKTKKIVPINVPVSPPQSPAPAPIPEPLVDPWKTIKSPFGGKMSPKDEWSLLLKRSDTAGHTFSGCCLSSSSFADLPASTDTLAITNCTGELQLPPLLLATLISLEITSSPIAPEVLSHPNFLRALNLTNALPALPPTLLSSFPNLLSLNLSHNPLTTPPSFPPSFTNTLRDLNLENCRLTTIANALTELTQLKILNVACNDMPVEELTVMSTLTWPSKLESLTLLPMPSLSASPTFPRALTLLLKKSICLKTLNCAPFEQTMTVDVQKLASMDLHAGDDDPNVKDSATCSCVEGNACVSKYNCKPHIWHRRFEVARLAREGGVGFEREKYLSGEL